MGRQAKQARLAQELDDKTGQFWNQYFCGCGDSDAALEAFQEIMELFVDRPPEDNLPPYLGFDRWNAYAAKHGLGLTYCILYWLDGMGLTEHGGSVGGSWMTELGSLVRMQALTSTDSDQLGD